MRVWNRLPRPRHSLPALAFAAVGLVAAASMVWAHEGREVHGFTFDVGFLVEPAYEGQPNGVYLSVTRAGDDHHGSGPSSDGGHEHGGTVETSAMSVAVTAEVDPIDGINVHIIPTGFVFAPERVNQADVDGEGHAHVLRGRREGGPSLRRVVPPEGRCTRGPRDPGDAADEWPQRIRGGRAAGSGGDHDQRSRHAAGAGRGGSSRGARGDGNRDQPGAGSTGWGEPEGDAAGIHACPGEGECSESGG